jgi:hypothetical protein
MRATGTASTSVVTTGEGHTGGIFGQPSSNDHAGEAGFQMPTDKFTLSATSSSPQFVVPTSIHAALADPSLCCAMEKEYDALITNNTWDLVPHPVSSNVVTGKWIFKHKFNSDGTLELYKACWVLCGFTQWLDVDYDETFSPVVKPATIHTVLSLVVSRSQPVQ